MGRLRDLIIRIRGDKTQLDTTLSSSQSSISTWSRKIMGYIAAAFGVGAIVRFTKESMKLAAEAEGVKNAFMKIGDAQSVLEDLKKATRGVIEESDLMTLAIKAQNFKIPLQDLAKYLDFATKRAIVTGKSVAELAELIVAGIGRKSSRSMIQLGLAAKDVQEAFKTTGGFMALVTAETEKMGDVTNTAAIRYGQLTASMKDLKEAWGGFVNNAPIMKEVTQWATDLLKQLAEPGLTPWQKFIMNPDEYNEWKKQQAEIQKAKEAEEASYGPGYYALLDEVTGKKKEQAAVEVKEIETLTTLNAKLAEYKTELNEIDINDRKGIETLNEKIKALEEYIRLLQSGQSVGAGSVKPPVKIQGKGYTPQQKIDSFTLRDVKLPEIPEVEKLFDIPKEWEATWKSAIYSVSDYMAEAFAGVFEAIGEGSFKDLGKELLISFGRLLSNLGKMLISFGSLMLVTLILSKTPSIPTALAAIGIGAAAAAIGGAIIGAAGRGGSNLAGGGGGSYGSSSNQPQTIKVEVTGSIKGRDIAIAGQRYIEDSDRST